MNAADILSKHWGYQQVWPMLKPLMFWEGDTATLIEDEEVGDEEDLDRQGSDK
jgi:hypothetical protein